MFERAVVFDSARAYPVVAQPPTHQGCARPLSVGRWASAAVDAVEVKVAVVEEAAAAAAGLVAHEAVRVAVGLAEGGAAEEAVAALMDWAAVQVAAAAMAQAPGT